MARQLYTVSQGLWPLKLRNCTPKCMCTRMHMLVFMPAAIPSTNPSWEESSLPMKHAKKIIKSIFLTTKATIRDTHGRFLTKILTLTNYMYCENKSKTEHQYFHFFKQMSHLPKIAKWNSLIISLMLSKVDDVKFIKWIFLMWNYLKLVLKTFLLLFFQFLSLFIFFQI